jgi:penicillin-binding protein 1A
MSAELPLEQMKWARPYSPSGWTAAPRDPAETLRPGDIVLVKVLSENIVYTAKPDPKANADVDPPPVKTRSLLVGLEQIPKVQGAIVAIEPNRHSIVAMAGGYDFSRSSFDRASQARRQPGSSFKPIVYATGIASGLYTPASMLTDAPKVYRDSGTNKAWKPANYDGTFRGDITLRQCLAHSVNMCSIEIIDRVGVDKVIELAQQMGIHSELPSSLTLALGAGDVTPLEMANAYATIANGGRSQEPVIVERVKGADGQILQEASFEQQQALDPAVAFVMTHLMRSVVEEGTAQKAKLLGRPVAGKTGTSNEQRNAWFIGFTPDLVAAVYVGFDDNASLGRSEYGSRAALPIWLRFMEQALEGSPTRDFSAPQNVVFARINSKDGLLTDANDSDAIDEVFIEGQEPTGRHGLNSTPPPLFMHDTTGDL